jgi:thymidylate kinase
VKHLVSRVVIGRGSFDFWESGMDMRFGRDMYESFLRYQSRLVRALDRMEKRYDFQVIDASKSSEQILRELQRKISRLFAAKERKPKTTTR